MATRQDRIIKAQADVRAQRRWMDEHGSDLAGYVARYGSKSGQHHGDGGEAIHAADVAELERRLAVLEALLAR